MPMSRSSRTAPPRARRDGLIVQKLAGETLVYDTERDKAHCLPPALAAIWERCDGRSDTATIAGSLPRRVGGPIAPELVEVALHRLSRARLLEPRDEPGLDSASRRQWLRQAAAF